MSVQRFDPIAVSAESTVVAEYSKETKRSVAYQSEADLEKAFIELLKNQAYEYLSITSEIDLSSNLKLQLERLNKTKFSDSEWELFFKSNIAGEKDGVIDKTRRIQEDHVQVLKKDSGEFKNIYLIDKQNIHNNKLQVINQYEAEGTRANRYDVTILVNGLPLVHVELKRRGVDLREAFNQIKRYQRDSFWADSGLFQYVQLFVISNGTYTKYYSNTVRDLHIREASGNSSVKKTSNTYEFTSWWADANNTPITDLMDFGATFFAKHSLLNVLTRYCVFTVDQSLLVMRPYQIVATERILTRTITSQNAKQLGTTAAGGYIWHTTGSGKTLTSFKTAQLVSRLPDVDKTLFVVDRKDLDYQTMREYDRFEKGAANGNKSTSELKRQLEDPKSRIIITTIQKLTRFIEANKSHEVTKKRVVLIFDECHRSQFGDMHTAIRRAFSNYNLFGFTGTPIFSVNAGTGGNPQLKTTEQAFGDRLHTYTIVDAIRDKNVLPFRVDYVNTFQLPDDIKDKKVSAIDIEKALLAPQRIEAVTKYILEHFDQKTRRNESYRLADRRVSGFNSLLATQSIDAAKRYYAAIAKAQGSQSQKLKVGIIYSFAPNEEDPDGLLAEEAFETDDLDKSSRDFLDNALADYNKLFSTNWDTSSEGFQGYYKDLAMRLKNREIDLVIVVNMFLTGFDATTLNTLWVDKNLRQHGLLQAFSRTNRILNRVKTYGNIVCFRDIEQQTQEAISLFGNKEAAGIVILRPYGEYFSEYQTALEELTQGFNPGEIPLTDADKSTFVGIFNKVLRLRNILVSFDEFATDDQLAPGTLQDYQSTYLEIHRESANRDGEKESILQDVLFELELVKQVEVNIDYILDLVKQNQAKWGNKEIKAEIELQAARAVGSSPSLRSKKDLIQEFIASINVQTDVDSAWKEFVKAKRDAEIQQLVSEENLNEEEFRKLIGLALRTGTLQVEGSALVKVLPARSIFEANSDHGESKRRVQDLIRAFFERFYLLGG